MACRSAESVEGRGLTKENAGQSLLDRIQRRNADGTPSYPGRADCLVYDKRHEGQKMRFTNLLHHITPELLRGASSP